MKTTEIVFDEVTFQDRRHYRLLIDDEEEPRGIITAWSEKSKTPKFANAQLYQPDNRKKITLVVQAMVNGQVTEVDRGEMVGELYSDTEQLTCTMGIGKISTTCKVIRQTVLDMLKMADFGQSITGVDISCGIGGQHDTIDKTQTIFYDMRVKIRDEQDTVIGSGKIGPKKSGVFLPLAPKQIERIKGGKYNLELIIGDGEPLDLPLYPGICCTAVPAAIDPKNTVLLTTCVKYDPTRWSGVVHSVYTYLNRGGGEKETHLKDLKKAPLDKLLRSMVLHTQVVKEDGTSNISDESILQSVVDFPHEASDKIEDDTSNGDFFINEVIHRHYKGHEFEIDEKSLRKHTGTVYCDAPSDISKPISLRTHFVDADFAEPTEEKVIGMNYKDIVGVALLEEQGRQIDETTKAVTVKLAGTCEMTGHNEDMKAALDKLDTKLAIEMIFTMVPNHKPPLPEIAFLPDTPEKKVEVVVEDHREELDELEAKLKEEHEGRLKEHENAEQEHEAYTKEHEALEKMQSRYNEEMDKLKQSLKKKSDLVDHDEEEISTLQAKLKEMDKILAGGNFHLPIAENDDDLGDPNDLGRERANTDGEMPGVSVLEDMVHRESIDSIYDSFHELYDEDERSVEAHKLGAPGEGFSPKQVLGRKRATKAGFALAHVIKAELVEKQKVIDRLLDEAKDRADAIDLCGVEIRKLRDDVGDWKQRAQDSATELVRERESHEQAGRFIQQKVGSPEELSVMNRATLIHVALELGERVRAVEAEGAEYKQRYMEGQAARQKYNEQTKMLQDLSEAHMQQSYFIQKLQKKVAKMDTYKSTIRLQESIIGKMQKVVEAHLKTSALDAGGGGRNDLLDRLMAEIEHSEENNQAEQRFQEKVETANERARNAEESLLVSKKTQAAMESEIDTLRKRLSELEDAPMEDTEETRRKISVLEAELTASQYRVSALEEQLELQAQESGKEISRLRTRLFDFEMAAILAEDLGNPMFEGDDAYVPSDIATAPTGSAKDAVQAINEAKKEDDPESADKGKAEDGGEEKVEMTLTDEIKLSVSLVKDATDKGVVDIFYKMRYSTKAPHPMQPDTPLDVLVQRMELRDYPHSPEEHGEDLRLQLDVSFDKDSWKNRSAALPASGGALVWDFYRGAVQQSAAGSDPAANGEAAGGNLSSQHTADPEADKDNSTAGGNTATTPESPEELLRKQMSWTTQFSNVSSEYIFVRVFRAPAADSNEKPSDDELLLSSGRSKFIHSDGAEESRRQAEEDGLEPHPDADLTPDEPEHPHAVEGDLSPRPVPTGRLHHNMHVLNSIVRMIGKTASYIDTDEADEAHFENPDHAPDKVATVVDNTTGQVVRADGEDNSSVATSKAGSKAGGGSQAGSKAGSKPGSKAGTDAGTNDE